MNEQHDISFRRAEVARRIQVFLDGMDTVAPLVGALEVQITWYPHHTPMADGTWPPDVTITIEVLDPENVE